MAKVYESDDTVVYRNEDGDTWVKNTETDERTYIPAGSEEPAGIFDSTQQIDNNEYDDDNY